MKINHYSLACVFWIRISFKRKSGKKNGKTRVNQSVAFLSISFLFVFVCISFPSVLSSPGRCCNLLVEHFLLHHSMTLVGLSIAVPSWNLIKKQGNKRMEGIRILYNLLEVSHTLLSARKKIHQSWKWEDST